MKNLFTKSLFLLITIFTLTNIASGQTLYALKKTVNGSNTIPFDIVKVDANTGNTTFVVSTDSLVASAAGATAYDQRKKRYICWGYSLDNGKDLYIADLDDSLTTILPIPDIQPIEIEYDLKTQTTYGLWWDGNAEHFGEIDLTTGQATSIATLPGVDAVAIGNSTFDSNTGTYIFIGVDGNDFKLYSIKASDGSILEDPIIYENGERFSALEYNVNDSSLYAMYQDVDSSIIDNIYMNYYTRQKLAKIDLEDASIEIVNDTAIIEGHLTGYSLGNLCFDQLNETYIVVVVNEYGSYLKMIDVSTGSIMASTSLMDVDYFYELQVDNTTFARQYYNWTNIDAPIIENTIDLSVYPNPARTILNIKSDEIIERVLIYNVQGQLVLDEKGIKDNRIDLVQFSQGTYYLLAMTKNGFVRKTFIKE